MKTNGTNGKAQGMLDNGLVAVADGTQCAGKNTYWSLSGDIAIDALAAAWAAAGLPEEWIPEMPEPATALRLAVGEQREARRPVRPLAGKGGYVVKREAATEDDVEYDATVCTAKVDKLGRLAVEGDRKMGEEIHAAFMRHLACIGHGRASTWLCTLVEKCGGVSLRSTGGLYFVPQWGLAQWESIVGAVRSSTAHVIYGMPTLTSADAVEAILDGLTAEMDKTLTELREQVQEGSLGKRALENRLEGLNKLGSKLGKYEALLGTKLDSVRDALGNMEAEVSNAIIVADPDGKFAALASDLESL